MNAQPALCVVSYNTLNGGRDRDGSLHRLTDQLDMLKELAPDVVCLQEGKRWDENGGETLSFFSVATPV
ncbi:endonuclease/exonuclease/phosphatase family protein [Streptomyces sp. CWNU-52B]|uniref:endonuclease/exonuclease/phosphatase family protein n=1 Tax=unclassified Streptomyces TaxID=2593676 RepID=UPI0039C240E7